MSPAVANEVVAYTSELEKVSSELQFLIDEIKTELRKTQNEFGEVQSSLTEDVKNIETRLDEEVQKLKELIEGLSQQFEAFKQQTATLVDGSQATTGALDSTRLNQLLEEHADSREKIAQLEQQLSRLSQDTPEKLRSELITGIRMLGDRVSKAIEEINERIDNFTNEIYARVNATTEEDKASDEPAAAEDDEGFASLKESALLDVDDYEVVPRKALKKLTELFRRQSASVRSFVEQHEQKIQEFEQLLRTYDEENTRLLELLDRRVKRNFLISMGAIALVVIGSVIVHIFF